MGIAQSVNSREYTCERMFEEMEEQVLAVEGLCKSYKDFQLNNITFSLDRGYILGIIGRNGAGKTTLMNCILGKLRYDEGTVQISDSVKQEHVNMAKQDIGFIVEPGPFLIAETLERNGEYLGRFYDDWEDGAFLNYLREFGLDRDDLYCNLSRGMKTRFQLAFALAHKPKLLVLDEPTAGLDPVFRQDFLSIIQSRVRDTMMSVIISTHLTTDLDKVADYIMMMDDGEKLFYMDKEKMLDAYPLISGKAEYLSDIEKGACGRIRNHQGTFTTMFKDTDYLKNNPQLRAHLQVERTTIEEIMYYLSATDL